MAQKRGKRYDVSRLTENLYQPGSRGRVLRNLLAITYFAAVCAGLDRNYKPMEVIFELMLNRTSSGA